MDIKKIGNYTIVKIKDFKQVYSETRALQVGKKGKYYIDLINNKVLKDTFERSKDTIKRSKGC